MNILILGITGSVGKCLYESMSHLPFNIYGFSRSVGLVSNKGLSFEFNSSSLETVLHEILLITRPHAIVNCIGCYKSRLNMASANIHFPYLLCKCIEGYSFLSSTNRPILYHISSIGVLGLYNHTFDFANLNLYEKTKYISELLLASRASNDLKIVLIRPSTILNPGSNFLCRVFLSIFLSPFLPSRNLTTIIPFTSLRHLVTKIMSLVSDPSWPPDSRNLSIVNISYTPSSERIFGFLTRKSPLLRLCLSAKIPLPSSLYRLTNRCFFRFLPSKPFSIPLARYQQRTTHSSNLLTL